MIPIIIVLLVSLIFYIGYSREKNAVKAYLDGFISNQGKPTKRKITQDELKGIKIYCDYKKDSTIDDITWNDLDLNLVYRSMNYCQTSAGDEYLYHLLRTPKLQNTDWEKFEQKVETIKNDPVLRKSLLSCLYEMGFTGNISVFSYLEKLDQIKLWNNKFDILLDLLYIPAIAMCFVNGLMGAALVFLIMIVNISTYFKKKRRIENFFVCFQYISRVLSNSESLSRVNCEILKEELTDLVNTTNNMKSFRRFSELVVGDLGSSPIGIILDYVKMLTHIDLIKFNSMYECVKNNKSDIINILDVVGRIDTIISIGEYRAFIKQYCVPDLNDNNNGLNIVEGNHPLLKNSVPNSIDVSKSVLLTGSNASGKSTFLKMIAINVLLAQTIHTCLAQKYVAPYYVLYSSLSLKDNIISGDSYYMAEIKALKRISDATKHNKNVICFVDEILKGTNTVERIAASSGILKHLIGNNVLVFAATHDIELTDILDMENYHFEENINDNDISFSYKLLKGKATTRNAITLLDYLNFDKSIIEEARNLVAGYEQKGNWNQ